MTGTYWHTGDLFAFDLETTGVDVETARIVTASIVDIEGGVTGFTSRNWLVNPGVEIPAEAAAIHGVTTEKARAEGVDPIKAITEIVEELTAAWDNAVPVIAYNGCYDLTVLDREMRRHGLGHLDPARTSYVIDPLVLDKAFDRYRKGKRTLTAACERYGIVLDEADAHTSAADALAAARVAYKLAVKFAAIRTSSLEDLHAKQAGWYAEQQASFADYLRRLARTAQQDGDPDGAADLVERADGITGEWPLKPLPAAEQAIA